MKHKILSKRTILSFVVLALLAFSANHVFAYINFNTGGPDTWLNPGYRWNVGSDTISGQSVCIQWSTDTVNWDRSRCTPLGGTSWQCDIPSNFSSTTVRFQFYKDVWDDNCAVTGNEWEWTEQFTFNTGPTAVSLSSFTAQTTPTLPLLLVFAGLMIGGTVWIKRK